MEGIMSKFVVSAGEILKAELKARNIKQCDFAKMVGMPKSHISEIINGKKTISQSVAEKIAVCLGISPEMLLNVQTKYKLSHSITKDEIEEQEAKNIFDRWNEYFDLKSICKRLIINIKSSYRDITNSLSILNLDNMNAQLNGCFRKSQKTGLDTRMINSWAIIAKAISVKQEVICKYDKNNISILIEKLRGIFHENKNTLSRLEPTLSEYGIRFCVVEKLERASVDGFSFIEDGIPSIIVTKRFDRIDNLAFNVMHELGHIILHLDTSNVKMRLSFAETDGDETSKEETEADTFAVNALIKQELWDQRPRVTFENIFVIQKAFTRWAIANKINKWIVLGRMSKETGMYKFKADDSRKIN